MAYDSQHAVHRRRGAGSHPRPGHPTPAPRSRRPTPRRLTGDGGAVLVEAAMVLPMLLSIVFGVIDFGYEFSVTLELRSAAREGARMAAVNNGCSLSTSCGTSATQLANLKTKTKDRASGLADKTKITVVVCYPATKRPGVDDVTVTVSTPAKSLSGLFPMLNGRTITAIGIMRLEQTPTFDKDTSCP